ncbi:transcription factor S [Candidatus Pacearchaeota archaeon]|nr:transcription factor S [Candidatus Pacearchaeota archaeon]
MEFCEKCGGIIILKDGKAVCAGCGRKINKKLKIRTSEKVAEKKGVAVVKKEDNVNPVVDMRCPKCKNKKCYFWAQQTRASDESETKFYKCTKCEHTWRAYR